MSVFRRLISLFLIILPLMGVCGTKGMALLHGTNDHRLDADLEYWKPDFTNFLKTGLDDPNNFLIVACDFRGLLWDEAVAGCTVDQLLAFSDARKITELTVYTHSHGGNVMRWILSNPTYDPRYLKLSRIIKQVIAIAPSSAGTPLADAAVDGGIFNESLGWLLGYHAESVKQQRVGDMAILNDQVLFGTNGRPSLSKPFRVIVGSEVIASPFSQTSYCNGYMLNSALSMTKLYLEDCADGFLNCSSQLAAGELWFIDKEQTTNHYTLSHNQSRHSCFGLEEILRNDFLYRG